jgi:phosphohistidine phosphatase SixA
MPGQGRDPFDPGKVVLKIPVRRGTLSGAAESLRGRGMQVLLIRHGTRGDGQALGPEGVGEARALAAQLRRLQLLPDVTFTGPSDDARQTVEVLRAELDLAKAPSPTLDALETVAGADWFDRLLDELDSVRPGDTVAIVGNEPRLSLILAESTGRRLRPLSRAEAVLVSGEDVQQYRRGGASVEFRTGLKGEPEDVLRDKLHSKTAVATLLAGFMFAALIELLTGRTLSDVEAAAAGLLTLSLALLIACVYVYDQLALPAGFWSASERSVGSGAGLRARLLDSLERVGHELRMRTSRRPEARRSGFVFHHALRNHGVVYAYMVWTWQWIFTPAILAGLAGFILLLVDSERTLLLIGGIVALALACGMYLALRPRLGPD